MSFKRLAWTGAFALATISTLVLAQDSKLIPPPADRDLFVGVWQANGDKSRPKLTKVERSYTRTIRRTGEDIIFSSTGGPSKATIREFRIRCDGAFHPLPAGPVQSCRWIDTNSIEGETQYPGGRKSYWVREVTPDGQTMTITDFKDKARTKVASLITLDRVK
jgi:hypothetical protein